MIEITISNAHGKTILYPADTMSWATDHKDLNNQPSLLFFGPSSEDTHLHRQQSPFDRKNGLGQVNPYAVIGECRVVDYMHVGEYISLGDIEFIDVKYKERILVKTPTDRFVHLHSEAASHLVSKEITLFGIDTLMQGKRDRLEFTAHRKFKERGITVIEGLDLSNTPGGRYFLIGLPSRLAQGESVPARVYLIPL